MSWLSELQELPAGVRETTQLLAQVDQCFLVGFARLGQSHFDSLAALQRIYAGTPLAQPLDESISALSRSEFTEQHFTLLAIARASLQGAQYTALHRHAGHALGRPSFIEIAEDDILLASENNSISHENTRHWLMELALTGFGQLDVQMIAPFKVTLSQIQGTALQEPAYFAHLALLTNFVNELVHASMSYSAINREAIPIGRWADIWTRAMVGTTGHAPPLKPELVTGTLYPLGVDLHQHEFTVSVIVYALLDHTGHTQAVRITLSAYKVDVIRGDNIWLLFPQIEPLLNALSVGKSVSIKDMSLLPTSDLCWPVENGDFGRGQDYDPLAEAEKWFAPQAESQRSTMPYQITPIDRHPIQLAELAYLRDYKVNGDNELSYEGISLPIALERLPAISELTTKVISGSNRMIGLLRFDDNQWRIQPLTVAKQTKSKAKLSFIGQQGLKLLQKPPTNNIVETLQERASRLLRPGS